MFSRVMNWRRFSLRTLFVLMTLFCVLFGGWAAYVNPYRRQLESRTIANDLEASIAAAPAEGPGWQRWLVTTLLGDDAFVQVTEVKLTGKKVTDEKVRALNGLIHLRKLSLDSTPVTDKGITVLRAMPRLQELSLRYTQIGDASVAHIAALPELRTVYLTGTKLTDAGAAELSGLQSVDEVFIRWTGVTNDGAARLAKALPNGQVHHHALTEP